MKSMTRRRRCSRAPATAIVGSPAKLVAAVVPRLAAGVADAMGNAAERDERAVLDRLALRQLAHLGEQPAGVAVEEVLRLR